MFDDVFGMTERILSDFQGGVRDSFGASIVADVLEPIRREIGSLRTFHEDFDRQQTGIETVLQEVRSFKPHGGECQHE